MLFRVLCLFFGLIGSEDWVSKYDINRKSNEISEEIKTKVTGCNINQKKAKEYIRQNVGLKYN